MWSQSVLERIRKVEIRDLVKETRRLINGDGISVHGVDPKDHKLYAHNNLRISDSIWEYEFMVYSGYLYK